VDRGILQPIREVHLTAGLRHNFVRLIVIGTFFTQAQQVCRFQNQIACYFLGAAGGQAERQNRCQHKCSCTFCQFHHSLPSMAGKAVCNPFIISQFAGQNKCFLVKTW
jgi:hypothetical protein